MTGDPTPTPDQRQVIELSPDNRAFVIAGPGAGKTWTLLQRARKLTVHDGLQTAELLVLSFTRAVVAELRHRDRVGDEPSRIRPETFDAFATRLLSEHASNDRWQTAGFDGRIEAATGLIEAGVTDESLRMVRHVLLDEVQDLVDVRARFVLALLEAYPGGFTAFGDPAQAIYDHERGRRDDRFLDLLQADIAEDTFALEGNHRASPELASVAADLRRRLLNGNSALAARATREAFGDLPACGNGRFEELAEELGVGYGGTAVLCRDNATALQLSELMHREGLAHRVRRSSLDRPVAGWVTASFGSRATLSREALSEALVELGDLSFPGLPDQDRAWSILSRLDPRARGGAVRASEAGSRIATGRVPWELYDEPEHTLVLSSIHRAKGLEFNGCVIVEWAPHAEQDEGLEARVLFVALTRARRDCWYVAGPARRTRWFRQPDARDRIVKLGRERWQTFGIEVRGDDAHALDPGGSFVGDCDPREVQDALRKRVRLGDAVTLELRGEVEFPPRGHVPLYAILHDGEGEIGVTSQSFGEALRSRLGYRRPRPRRISDVRVHDLETVKGPVEVGEAAGLGRSGLWLRPRLIGLGNFEWGEQ